MNDRHNFFSKIDFEALLQDSKKSSQRQIQIVESAIDLLHSNGLDNFSYELLSQKCGIARSLVYHYYPTLTELLLFMSALIRYRYQLYVIERMSQETDIQKIFTGYVLSALDWLEAKPKDASVWLLYFHRCTVTEELAEFNRKLVDMGTDRIETMLSSGVKQKKFKIAPRKIPQTARLIQLLITGTLLSKLTEKRTAKQWKEERNLLVETCLSMAQALQSS
jgi:AcrR family transcriptional regulator